MICVAYNQELVWGIYELSVENESFVRDKLVIASNGFQIKTKQTIIFLAINQIY